MAERMQRTQILLEPAQHRALADLARSEGRSISDVVRGMVREQLARRQEDEEADLQRQLAALEGIRQHRDSILSQRGGRPLELDVVEMIHQMRAERDAVTVEGLGHIGD